jgi:UDP-glucose:(heptosyl)LPS alpha-1,3-glucosyltransferase
MKIAFAIEHFSPRQGGAERYAWGLARWLACQGHSMDVLTTDAPDEHNGQVAIRLLDVPSNPRNTRPARFAAAVTAALQRQSYDVVHAFNHAWPCDVLRLGGGVHLAFEKYNALSSGRPFQQILKALSYRILQRYRALRENERRQFDHPRRLFIAISQKVADDMVRFYPSSEGRIRVIRNGLDPAAYNPDLAARQRPEARARLGLTPETIALLFVSNNYRLKGLHDLIEALPLVAKRVAAPIKLLVVGRGNSRPFERLAARCHVQDLTCFCGHAESLLDVYAGANVLVHPSYYDAFGFVCLEAMACGLAVVVSRNSGVSEIMEEGNGSVFVDMPCPRESLAGAIVRAVDPLFLERAKTSQWQLALQHPIEKNYQAVLDLYEQVAAEKSRRTNGSISRACRPQS